MATYAFVTIEMVVKLEDDQLPRVREVANTVNAEGVDELIKEGKGDDLLDLLSVAVDPYNLVTDLGPGVSADSARLAIHRIDGSLSPALLRQIPQRWASSADPELQALASELGVEPN